jgi:hypothetical protein
VAEVITSNRSTSLTQQLWLVIGLRWKLFRNGIRSQSEKMHLLGSVLLGLVFGVMVLGVSFGIGFGSYILADSKKWSIFVAIFWGIFVFWQFFPVLASQTNPGFDGRNMLRFPLRFSAFLLMSVAYGLADPFALAGMLWHIAIVAGVSIARPDLVWWALLAVALAILMNLLFNRMMYAWLERILAKRRVREVLAALFILSMISLQFTSALIQRWRTPLMNFVQHTEIVWGNLPPTEAGRAIGDAADGDAAAAWEAIGLIALYAGAFGGLFAFRAHAQYTGEDLEESAAPVAPRKRTTARAVSSVSAPASTSPSLISAPVAAVFWKEVRYITRNSMLLMNIFIPLLFIVFISFTSSHPVHPGRPGPGIKFSIGYFYPAAVAYAFLIIIQMCPNNLAYDGRGVERFFLSPIQFRAVMLGKNLFHASLLAMDALLVLALIIALGHTPPLLIILATWAALPFAAFVEFSIGNWLSLQYPRRFEFGVRRQRPSGLSMLISFSLYIAMMGVLALATTLCLWLAGLWLVPIVFLGLDALAFLAYRGALNDASSRAVMQRETLIEQLAK